MSNHTRKKVTVPRYAEECGVSPDKILAFIRSGELRAINFATKRGGRPRYLIDRDDIEAFEASRAVIPAPKATRRKRAAPADVIEFV